MIANLSHGGFIIPVYVVFAELCDTLLGEAKYRPKMDVARKKKFFGWRLHLICNPCGQPVAFELLPGAYHDLTPIFEITANLPDGASLYDDKGYNYHEGEAFFASEGLHLIPIRKRNMTPHNWADEFDLRLYGKGVEMVNSQLESMGLQRFRARTNEGFDIKVHASLIALWHTDTGKLAIMVRAWIAAGE